MFAKINTAAINASFAPAYASADVWQTSAGEWGVYLTRTNSKAFGPDAVLFIGETEGAAKRFRNRFIRTNREKFSAAYVANVAG